MSDDDNDNKPILDVVFYKTEAGNEPVREWLKSLPDESVLHGQGQPDDPSAWICEEVAENSPE